MKIEKLPSGFYRIRKMYRGKMQTVIFGTTPTQKEALKAMSAELEKAHERRSSRTFMESAEEHIESKRIVLSPSTVAGYRTSPQA